MILHQLRYDNVSLFFPPRYVTMMHVYFLPPGNVYRCSCLFVNKQGIPGWFKRQNGAVIYRSDLQTKYIYWRAQSIWWGECTLFQCVYDIDVTSYHRRSIVVMTLPELLVLHVPAGMVWIGLRIVKPCEVLAASWENLSLWYFDKRGYNWASASAFSMIIIFILWKDLGPRSLIQIENVWSDWAYIQADLNVRQPPVVRAG